MKKLNLTLLLLFITSIAICQNIIKGKVIRVADGDTITVLDEDNTQIRVRLYGIDCPESHQDFGAVAKKFTANHCFQKVVDVEVRDIDRYGRTVGKKHDVNPFRWLKHTKISCPSTTKN